MKIIGISLVRNEEYYIARVLANALALCDSIIVLDNNSSDGTAERVAGVAREHPGRVDLRPCPDLAKSHEVIQPYIGTDTWVFGVDGDEVYDPAGLVRLRAEILLGTYQNYWVIRANFLHCVRIYGDTAAGYLAPPTPDPSKLYNMGLLASWGVSGRHPLFFPTASVHFIDGTSRYADRHARLNEADWDSSYFRCLHLRFVPRSSVDTGDCLAAPRANPYDLVYHKRTVNLRERYRRGELVTIDTRPFFPGGPAS